METIKSTKDLIKAEIKAYENQHDSTKKTFGRASLYTREKSELFVIYTVSRIIRIRDEEAREKVLNEICSKCNKYFIFKGVPVKDGAIKMFKNDVNKKLKTYESSIENAKSE